MLTESSFHHRSHHNNGPVISQHRTHYAPYQHSSHPSKSSSQPTQQQHPQIPQQHHQAAPELQLSKFDLHHAVRTNDVAGIIRLHSRLRQQPTVADTCLLDSNGHTPLYTAIANGRLTIVDLLLHLGHNPVSAVADDTQLTFESHRACSDLMTMLYSVFSIASRWRVNRH
jgi:hypothetical protein